MGLIRALAITYYNGMDEVYKQVVEAIGGIELTICGGDLIYVRKLLTNEKGEKNFDLIIARGGASVTLRKSQEIPVISVEITGIDIIHVLRISQKHPGKCALVSFEEVTSKARECCEILDYPIKIVTVRQPGDIADQIEHLRLEGFRTVICDTLVMVEVLKQGLEPLILVSGYDSIYKAFSDGMSLLRYNKAYENKLQLIAMSLNACNVVQGIFRQDGELLLSSNGSDERTLRLLKMCRQYLSEAFLRGKVCSIIEADGELWNLFCVLISVGNELNAAVSMTSIQSADFFSKGILSFGKSSEIFPVFSSFTSCNPQMDSILHAARRAATNNTPLLLTGQRGTGRESLAYLIHQSSAHRNHPFIKIDCQLATAHSLNEMLENPQLQAESLTGTIYFHNINSLDKEGQGMLAALICSKYGHARRIASLETPSSSREAEIHPSLALLFNEVKFHLPTFSERNEDIPQLAQRMIERLNIAHGKNIEGIDDNALALLQKYAWQYNGISLYSFLSDLVRDCRESRISLASLSAHSYEEDKTRNQKYLTVELNKTLDEINDEVIRHVLAQENMNQTRACARLGIGRSTLWRKLK